MYLPGRHESIDPDGYRYGFNGMELDDEIKGTGDSYDFGARLYDSRIGRFFIMDKYEEYFPNQSPYVYAINSPIMFVDKNGDFPWWPFVKGASVAAFSEVTFQMIDYMILNGEFEFKPALNNIDWTDVGVEAGVGGGMEYVSFGSYSATKISKLFKGKYRGYTFYIMKETLAVVQDAVKEASKDVLNGREIDVVEILKAVAGDKIVGEIMSAKPFVPKALKRNGKKITSDLDKVVDLQKQGEKLNEKLVKAMKDGKSNKAERILSRIQRKAEKASKYEDRAVRRLAAEYESSGFTETITDEFKSRAAGTAKKYIQQKMSNVNIIVGEGTFKIDSND